METKSKTITFAGKDLILETGKIAVELYFIIIALFS